MNNISLELNKRKNGLVGGIGCGKSTIVQLMMRFYDPDEGRILLDGQDLRSLDLSWLRSQIGYLNSSPDLFNATLLDNILVGRADASEEDVRDALKKAELLDFVESQR